MKCMLCPNVDYYEETHDEALSCMFHPSAYVTSSCESCGWERKGGDCLFLHRNGEDELSVNEWGTTDVNGKKWQRQVVKTKYLVKDLVQKMKTYFKDDFLVHQTASKLQRNTVRIWLDNFETTDLIVKLDFSEKPTLKRTCGNHPTLTLMLSCVVHHSLWIEETRNAEDVVVEKLRKHVKYVWIFLS
jgi:hypothetical protein